MFILRSSESTGNLVAARGKGCASPREKCAIGQIFAKNCMKLKEMYWGVPSAPSWIHQITERSGYT